MLHRFGIALTLLVFLAAFALASSMHCWRGACDSGFGWADDEAAHMVSGVMIHDYVVDPEPANPKTYAENYYVHYPKVAIGQWPPVYHAMQAAWTLVFGVSRGSIVMLGACLMALVAALLFRVLAERIDNASALAAAGLFLLLPLVQRFGSMAMTELPLALFCCAAVVAFGRLLDHGRWRDGLWFALFSVLAILTKANAIALALVPPLSILMQRRWDMLRSKPMWTAALLVAIGSGPWTLYFLTVNRSTWGGGQTINAEFSLEAASFYGSKLIACGGVIVFCAALWGTITRLRDARREGFWIASIAWCGALLIFQIAIPSSIETRHLILIAPMLCMLAAAGARDLVGRIPKLAPRAGLISALALLIGFGTTAFQFPRKQFSGFDRAIAFITAEPRYVGSAVLIDSDAIGEGLAVSEFVLVEPARPNRYVMRSTKLLSHSSWIGEDYREFYPSAAELKLALDRIPIGLVLLDHSLRPHQSMPHHATLQRMLQTSDEWQLIESFDVQRGPLAFPAGLELWERSGASLNPPTRLEFSRILGRDVPL